MRIRNPIMYNTGTGATIATGSDADTLESQITLTVNTRRHVPMRFTSEEMTMKIDEFRTRHIEPAMSKLAAIIESDALNMVDEVPNSVVAGTAVNFADILAGGVQLDNELAPIDNRFALLDPQGNADMITDTKGLFHDQRELSKQYKTGAMGELGSFMFYKNTLLPSHTSGAEGGGSAYDANQVAAQVGTYTSPNSMSLIVDTGTKTIKEGDVFTIASVYSVHPETKVSTGVGRQFVALGDLTGAGTLSISPAIIASGPYKNCSAGAPNNGTITFQGAASTAYKRSLLFQKGFACFGTADLVLPPRTEASRAVKDGISIRLVKDWYDGVKDRLYTRLDVLYGYKVLRPGFASTIWHT